MSKTLGISFSSYGLQYAICEKLDCDEISIIEREKCKNPEVGRISESANWLHGTLGDIVTRHDISGIGFKVHFDLKKINDLYSHGLPVGVLAYFAAEQNMPIEGYTVRLIKGYRFLGLPKGSLTLDWVDANHRDGNKYWDSNSKYAVAIALKEMQGI